MTACPRKKMERVTVLAGGKVCTRPTVSHPSANRSLLSLRLFWMWSRRNGVDGCRKNYKNRSDAIIESTTDESLLLSNRRRLLIEATREIISVGLIHGLNGQRVFLICGTRIEKLLYGERSGTRSVRWW
jgi:hypothetical protein